MMTSLLWCHLFIEQSTCVLFSPPVLYDNSQVINRNETKTNNLNKSTLRLLMLNISVSFFDWNWHMQVRRYESINCTNHGIGHRNNMLARSILINNAFSAASKLRTPNVYCWSPYTGHSSRVNLICSKSFCPQKTNNSILFVTGRLQQQRRHI